MTALDLVCALCLTAYSSSMVTRDTRCGDRSQTATQKYADGCVGKLISIEPRKQQQRRTRAADKSATDESAEAVRQ